MLVGFHINFRENFKNLDEIQSLKTHILETACCTQILFSIKNDETFLYFDFSQCQNNINHCSFTFHHICTYRIIELYYQLKNKGLSIALICPKKAPIFFHLLWRGICFKFLEFFHCLPG